jgi:hypothetical protein
MAQRWVAVDMTLRCPICGAPTTIRTSRRVTDLLREEYIDCTSVTCPGRFKVNREIVASLWEGSFEHGLKIPQCLRKQALAPTGAKPVPPDPNQLELPGLPPADESQTLPSFPTPRHA